MPNKFIESIDNLSPKIAKSAFIHESAVIIGDTEIGSESSVWPNCTLRGDMGKIQIGDQTSIQDNTCCHMTNGLSSLVVGNRVTVGHGVILHGCIVEDDCLIGMGSILLDNCKIGRGSLIAAGTLITQNKVIPPNSLVMGNPGKIIRELTKEEKERIEEGCEHYILYAKKFKAAR